MKTGALTLVAAVILAAPATSQHEGHAQHSSPYAGQEDSGIAISAIIWVERDSQKGIAVGKNGSVLKKVGKAARLEIAERKLAAMLSLVTSALRTASYNA